jgi:hypothetical protein
MRVAIDGLQKFTLAVLLLGCITAAASAPELAGLFILGTSLAGLAAVARRKKEGLGSPAA